MSDLVNIQPCESPGYVMKLNDNKARKLGISKNYIGYASFGTKKCLVDIKISSHIKEDIIFLSKKVISYLYLPDYPDYEIYTKDNEIIIGPHIGIFYNKKDDKLTKAKLKHASRYLSQYSKLHGSILVFALDKVDKSERLIEGYCYNPKTDDWERATCPYPLSIFLWVSLSRAWKNHFNSVIGDTLFNNYFLNKYKMYNWLKTEDGLVNHLPHTEMLKSCQDVLDMLKIYNRVFLKPIAGLQGKGVTKVKLENDKVSVSYREGGLNVNENFPDWDSCGEYIEEKFGYDKYPNQYIVQQPIELMTYEGKVFDFRLHMVKGQSGVWECKAIVGRLGALGSIISNLSGGGKSFKGTDLLMKAFDLNNKQASFLEEDLKLFGLKVCNCLDKRGMNCGNIGLDVGIDKEKKMWLIEINSRRPPVIGSIKRWDEKLYEEILTAPMFYAKYLAGFKS